MVGKTFGQVGVERGGLHPVDAFLDLVVEHGTKVRWRTTISNHRPKILDKLETSGVQLGFSDAGAHLRNMAFYNFGLRLLRTCHDAEKVGRPFMTVEHAVHRLTGELAEWYSVDAGHLRVGDRADLVVIDPARLDDSLDDYAEAPVAAYDNLSRMVNRNDDAVTAVFVGGEYVFGRGEAAPTLGTEEDRADSCALAELAQTLPKSSIADVLPSRLSISMRWKTSEIFSSPFPVGSELRVVDELLDLGDAGRADRDPVEDDLLTVVVGAHELEDRRLDRLVGDQGLEDLG